MLHHKHKLCYVAYPKAASTSLRTHLVKFGFTENENHQTIDKIIENNPKVKNYTFFSVYREPIEHFKSAYKHIQKHEDWNGKILNTDIEIKNPDDYIKHLKRTWDEHSYNHEFFFSNKCNFCLDIKNLDDDFKFFCNMFNFKYEQIPVKNKRTLHVDLTHENEKDIISLYKSTNKDIKTVQDYYKNNMKVCVIGLGKLGLSYATWIARKGYDVIGVDKNSSYIESLQNNTFKTDEPETQEHINKVSEYSTKLPDSCDICIVLVDTPTCYAGYDHTNLKTVLETIPFKNVIVSSTTQPGFMKKHFYNPLFVQLGNIIENLRNTTDVLIGCKSENTIVEKFMKTLFTNDVNIHYMNYTAAEVAKLGLNCIITTKISFANMIGESLLRTDNKDEIEKVLDFIGSDERVGNKCLKFGWGYGGPCFPRDNRALCTFLRQVGAGDYIPVATHESNERHAITMARFFNKSDNFNDLNYKENCPIQCEEESHKIKTLEIIKNGQFTLME